VDTKDFSKSSSKSAWKKWGIISAVLVAVIVTVSTLFAEDLYKSFIRPMFQSSSSNRDIRVTSVAITSQTTIGINEEVALTVTILPANATNQNTTWTLTNNTASATVTNGVFVATQMGQVTVVATAGGAASDPITKSVIPIDVTGVQFANATSFRVTSALTLTAATIPANATNQNIIFELVDAGTTADGAQLLGTTLQATGLGVIRVRAYIDGHEAFMNVNVVAEPVTSVEITNELNGRGVRIQYENTFDHAGSAAGWILHNNVLANEPGVTGSFALEVGASSLRHTRKNITLYESCEVNMSFWARRRGASFDNIYIRASNDNGASWITVGSRNVHNSFQLLNFAFNGSQIFGSNRNILLDFRARNGVILIDDISYTITSDMTSFSAGSNITLTSVVNPFNATFPEVTFEIVSARTTASGAQINGNVLSATGQGIIVVRARAGGVTSEDFLVNVT